MALVPNYSFRVIGVILVAMPSGKPQFVIFLPLVIVISSLLMAQTATRHVVISVADVTGAAVSNAVVRIIPAPSAATPTTVDAQGHLTLDMKPGQYALFVRSQGFVKVTTHMEITEGKGIQTIPVVLRVASGGGPVVVSTEANGALTVIAYPYHDPLVLTFADMQKMPHISVSVHNPHSNADESYSGVRLAEVLGRVGAPLGNDLHGEALANYVVATGTDGYSAVLALGEVDPGFHPGEIVVADAMNGKPLDAHSGPLKLVVSEDKRPARSVRNLVTLELRSAQ